MVREIDEREEATKPKKKKNPKNIIRETRQNLLALLLTAYNIPRLHRLLRDPIWRKFFKRFNIPEAGSHGNARVKTFINEQLEAVSSD